MVTAAAAVVLEAGDVVQWATGVPEDYAVLVEQTDRGWRVRWMRTNHSRVHAVRNLKLVATKASWEEALAVMNLIASKTPRGLVRLDTAHYSTEVLFGMRVAIAQRLMQAGDFAPAVATVTKTRHIQLA
jgi:hypothetical protein